MVISRVLQFVRNSKYQSSFSDLESADFLIVRHDYNCGFFNNGIAYAQIVDSVVEVGEGLGYKFLTVAKPYSRYFGGAAYNNPYVFNRTFAMISALSKIALILVGKKLSSAFARRLEERFWSRVIRLVNPAAVIAIQPSTALCAAGKCSGVKVYDYQHGVISKDQRWYGKALQNLKSDRDLPAGILFWDDRSKSVLEEFGQERGIELHVVGNPWFERFAFPSSNDFLVAQHSKPMVGSREDKPVILVSLQWGLKEIYYKDVEFNGLMCDALVDVILGTCDIYCWKLRLHPIQLHSENKDDNLNLLKEMFKGVPNVEWSLTSDLPLPVLLKNVDLHITDVSTVVVEAAWFGIPSAILNPFVRAGELLENTFLEEREAGIVRVVEQSEPAITRWISEMLISKRECVAASHKKGLEEFLSSHIN